MRSTSWPRSQALTTDEVSARSAIPAIRWMIIHHPTDSEPAVPWDIF